MLNRWAITMHRDALKSLYTLPRGAAGAVTDAFNEFLTYSDPTKAEPTEMVKDTYRFVVGVYLADYEVIEGSKEVKILMIETTTE